MPQTREVIAAPPPGVSDPEASCDFSDHSLVRPAATRLLFRPAFRLVPRWLTANAITLLGLAATGTMFLLALFGSRLVPTRLAGYAVLALVGYALADHLDGMQALTSRTASPLGEFLDHYSDSVSGLFFAYVSFELMPGIPEGVRASLLVLYLLAFIITYQERAEHGRLHFARVGALEGLLILALFLGTSTFEMGREWWQLPLWAELPRYTLVILAAYAGFAGTLVVILGRIGGVPRSFLAHATAAALLAVASTQAVHAGAVSSAVSWALLGLHGVGYLATVMQPHLFGGRPRVDPVAPGLALLLLVGVQAASPGMGQGIATVALLWLGARVVAVVWVVLRAYGDAWRWLNPPGGGGMAPRTNCS